MPLPQMGAAWRTGSARRWLTGRCTLEAPSGTGADAGWGTLITDVPYRRDAPPDTLNLALGPPTIKQKVAFYLDPVKAAAADFGWRLTDEDGVRWRLLGGSASTAEPVINLTGERLP